MFTLNFLQTKKKKFCSIMSLLLNQSLNWSPIISCILYIGLLYLAYKLILLLKFFKKLKNFPGPDCGMNPLGNITMVLNSNLDVLTSFYDIICGLSKIYSQSYSFFRFWIGTTPIIVFFKSDSAEASWNCKLNKFILLILQWLFAENLCQQCPHS